MRRLLLSCAGALACVTLAALALLAAIDSGRLNSVLAEIASKRLNRPVAFETIRAHLLSIRPTLTINRLRIGSPAWAGPASLLEADRVRLSFRWPTLALTEIDVDRPRANLVRASRERNNWSSGGNGARGNLLDEVKVLRVTNGSFVVDDRVTDLRLIGTLSHDTSRNPSWPLSISARGELKGGDIQLAALGAPLTNRPRKTPYRFSLSLEDGATFLQVAGASEKPAQLDSFDLALTARGPNLSDMRYLINVGLPNSAPYRVTAKLSRRGSITRATALRAVVGRSDFTGSIVSDGSRKRRLITIKLDSQNLYAADVLTFLGRRPGRLLARSVSGATHSGGSDGRLFTTKPIDLTQFRQKDAKLAITARRFFIKGVSPGQLTADVTLDHGKVTLKPFRIAFPSGGANGVLAIDVNGSRPAFNLDGEVRTAELGSLVPGLAKTVNGTADLRVQVAAAGGSFREIALNADGRVGMHIRNGVMQASKAEILSGSIVQGAFTALANKKARTTLSCLIADLGVGHGTVTAQRILLVTDAGTAWAQGGIDLASETVQLTIYGRPSRFRLFAVDAPVSVSGPMLHPQTKLRLRGGPSGSAQTSLQLAAIKGDGAEFCSRQPAAAF